jgi:hypothetical protein
MTITDLQNILLTNSDRISIAISTGVQYEIWLQVEMMIMMRMAKISVAREVPYPIPNQHLDLDMLLGECIIQTENNGLQTIDNKRYAVELKTESPTNAGKMLLKNLQADMAKIAAYHTRYLAERWVVGIAHSSEAKNALSTYARHPDNNAIYNELNTVGFFIVSV